MALVNFYETSLSESDRCYDRDSYDTYLNNDRLVFTLDVEDAKDIIPNVPFYIDISNNAGIVQHLLVCNYITFTYNTVKYGAFIESIEPLAFANRFRIVHHVDVWYMARTLYEYSIDFHGACIRAHVNEIINPEDETLKVDFINTYNTPEETFSTRDLDTKQFPLVEDNDNYTWIYLYINNPNAIQFKETTLIHQTYTPLQSVVLQKTKTLQGLLLCGVLNKKSGKCYFNFNENDEESAEPEHYIYLYNLTSQYITVIFVSNIPPTQNCSVIYNNGEYTPKTTDYITNKDLNNSDGLPDRVGLLSNISLSFTYNTISDKFGDFSFNAVSNIVKEDYKTATYEVYLSKYIFKQFTATYNPAYIGNNVLDTTEYRQVTISLSPEGSIYWITPIITKQRDIITNSVEYLTANTIIQNNFYQFAPDTVFDYWTQIDSKRSIISSEQQRFGSIMQGISGTINGATNIVESVVSPISKGLTGGVAGAIGGVAGAIGGVAGGAAEIASSIGNAVYGVQQANLAGEIANQQYRTGVCTKDITTGYYGSMLDRGSPMLLWYKQNEYSLKNIAIRLHRYGYNTFLQIDDIYKNHRRRHFNYIKCPNIEVHGVPISIGNEVAQMFQNGVHLWSILEKTDEVGNFEVNNHEMSVGE